MKQPVFHVTQTRELEKNLGKVRNHIITEPEASNERQALIQHAGKEVPMLNKKTMVDKKEVINMASRIDRKHILIFKAITYGIIRALTVGIFLNGGINSISFLYKEFINNGHLQFPGN